MISSIDDIFLLKGWTVTVNSTQTSELKIKNEQQFAVQLLPWQFAEADGEFLFPLPTSDSSDGCFPPLSPLALLGQHSHYHRETAADQLA